LSKGFVEVAFSFGVVIVYALIAREAPRVRVPWLLGGGAVFCALALPWHVAMEKVNHPATPVTK